MVLLLSVQYKVKINIVLILLMLQIQSRPSLPFRMMVLDVGQGLAISIDYRDKLLIYDTAYGSADFSVAQFTLIPWLKSLSQSDIDLLVVGHNDADHAGGLSLMMETTPVTTLITGPDVVVPEKVKFQPDIAEQCYQGQSWQWDDLSIEVLSPKLADRKLREGNNSSCVLLLNIHGINILLTGDIEYLAEESLIENYPELSVDVLLVPHHGSKTSSRMAFVNSVIPRLVLISAGYKNQFGHPHG